MQWVSQAGGHRALRFFASKIGNTQFTDGGKIYHFPVVNILYRFKMVLFLVIIDERLFRFFLRSPITSSEIFHIPAISYKYLTVIFCFRELLPNTLDICRKQALKSAEMLCV